MVYPVYFGYFINAGTHDCGTTASSDDAYTFDAYGDLDGDNVNSTFELAIGTDDNNELYRSPGFYIVSELE